MEDNNSLNGTYLEDKKLQSDEKVRIQDGSRVRLSDEEFIFHINE
ncbi:FHA domain-containing protein [Blautia sp.]